MLSMFGNKEQVTMVVEEFGREKDRDQHMKEYIASLKAIEDAMEPYKEQKRDLRSEYVENGWLNKDEQRLAVRAYRLLKDEVDLGELIDMYDALKGGAK